MFPNQRLLSSPGLRDDSGVPRLGPRHDSPTHQFGQLARAHRLRPRLAETTAQPRHPGGGRRAGDAPRVVHKVQLGRAAGLRLPQTGPRRGGRRPPPAGLPPSDWQRTVPTPPAAGGRRRRRGGGHRGVRATREGGVICD